LGRGQRAPLHQLGVWGAVSSSSGICGEAPAAKSFDVFLCSQMTSPAIMENRVCTVQVYHFTHFVTHVRAIVARGPQELGGSGSLNRLRLNPQFLRHCAPKISPGSPMSFLFLPLFSLFLPFPAHFSFLPILSFASVYSHPRSLEDSPVDEHPELMGIIVAARGFLPPGANVCVAAPSIQIGN